MTDPFSAPAPVASAHASAQSFKGRLVLITPTKLELNVPKGEGSAELGNKVTANVLVVDGQGPVQVFNNRVATGKFLEGPEHIGVWFSQDRLAMHGGLVDPSKNPVQLMGPVLGRIETRYPDKAAGKGNPWGLTPPTEADIQTAREFLANRTVGAAAAPAPVAEDENPFGKGQPPF